VEQPSVIFGLQNSYSEWCLLCADWQSLRRPKRLIHMGFVGLDHWLPISGPHPSGQKPEIEGV